MAQQSDLLLERMLQLHPKLIDLTLDRMHRLLAAMDHPERALGPTIHIAGTNGKGSTLAYLEAMALGAGLTVNAYISPHLVRFHERIRIDGQPIDEAALARALDDCLLANDNGDITFFEITTAAAFHAFRQRPADLTLLEVGLGGRLDATNVIDAPLCCVITPVDLDHQQFLGDTLEAIAGEKAGIIKKSVPVVVSPQQDDAFDVIEAHAMKLGAPLHVGGQDWVAYEERGRLIFQDDDGLMDLPLPNLQGHHQINNAGTAIAAAKAAGLGFSDEQIAHGISHANWPARMMALRDHPLLKALPQDAELWLDGGHNPAAGKVLAAHLEQRQSRDPRPLYLICGMLNTKDAGGYLRCFAPLDPTLFALPIPDEQNSLDAESLAKAATQAGLNASPTATVQDAIAHITEPRARVMICGSLYLAGHVLGMG